MVKTFYNTHPTPLPKNTHLFRRGKHQFVGRADLLFDWFGFSCFVYLCLVTNRFNWSAKPKLVKQEVSLIQ